MKGFRWRLLWTAAVCMMLILCSGCGRNRQVLKILSGSENQELEAILDECSRETGVDIQMEYRGSVDIMRTLEAGGEDYDAVWPASSIWISLGDR